jgi:hypothetical protein
VSRRAAAGRYPLALAALERRIGARPPEADAAAPLIAPLGSTVLGPTVLGPTVLGPTVLGPTVLGPTVLGPPILRPPPELFRRAPRGAARPALDEPDAPDRRTEDLLGELVDMVFVSADDAAGSAAEVHLVFKAEVLGGLHLRLQKRAEGMHATFLVEDSAARRAVLDHADGLVRHLRDRGFSLVGHEVKIANAGEGAP